MSDNSLSKKMDKAFNEYGLYVFDLDGTLYFQKQLRAIMACRLLGYYILHPFNIRELLIIKKFREVREKWDDSSADIDEKQYEYVAKQMNLDTIVVEGVVKKWIYDNPLDAVKKSADKEILKVIESLRNKGSRVVIFSDYPTRDKLNALGITVDGQYCSTDETIGELKPSGKGLKVIMNDFSIKEKDVILIGDRYEKDGKSAINAGCDFLILERSRSKRTNQYSLFFS